MVWGPTNYGGLKGREEGDTMDILEKGSSRIEKLIHFELIT